MSERHELSFLLFCLQQQALQFFANAVSERIMSSESPVAHKDKLSTSQQLLLDILGRFACRTHYVRE